jgi:hypothetical protein
VEFSYKSTRCDRKNQNRRWYTFLIKARGLLYFPQKSSPKSMDFGPAVAGVVARGGGRDKGGKREEGSHVGPIL